MRLGSICYSGLRALGLPAAARRLRHSGLILCYHNVVAHDDGAVGDTSLHLPVEQFAAQVRWLADHYEVISLRALADHIRHGESVRGMAAITFDDGYAGVFEHAVPVLQAHRLPATVFVVADASTEASGFWWDHPAVTATATPRQRRRWLNELAGDADAILADIGGRTPTPLSPSHRAAPWDVIREAGPGIDIGVHSATHRALPMLPDRELEREIVDSRAAIHAATGIWPNVIAYPYGLSSTRV
ncbi:MAG TPA: polysaccharide deacetylase family protein, partial [Vicinamibacterales bacterium]|nr:polysaccharide deacetylase family protein [Vicinamibacterales bacterium]